MDLRDDERAQTVQVGAILLLGTLVIALSVYQVTSVPGQNAETEFTHNQAVHEQLQEVRTAILEAAATGQSRSATVRLGTQYRDRTVAVNPGPPSGTLRTRTLPGGSAIRIANATAVAGATGCWGGTDREVTTKGLVYRPDYNEYRTAPTTGYENSVLYDRFERENTDTVLNATGQRLVSGRRLSLVALGGSYAESRSGTVSVDARPAGSATETITVTNSDGPLTLVVSTNLSQEMWRDLLDGERVANGGYIRAPPRVENGSLTIELKRGVSYDLSLARVTLGGRSDAEGIHCLTGVSGNNSIVSEDDSQELVFELHDQYNAPVPNETVELAVVDGPGSLQNESVRTDGRGRVVVTYRAPSNVDGPDVPVTIRATSNDSRNPLGSGFDRTDRENVAYDLTVRNDDGSLEAIQWNTTAIGTQSGVTCANDSCTYDPGLDSDGAFEVFAEADPPAVANVAVASSDESVASYGRRDDATNRRGRATATVLVGDTGTATLTVAGGGQRDTLSVEVLNREPTAAFGVSPADPETGQRVEFDARGSSDPDNDALTYEWDFGDGNTSTTSLPTTEHVYGDDGTYDATLTVIDEHGGRNATTETIAVSNRAPIATIDTSTRNPNTGEIVVFDAADSFDPDGEITSYEWDLDGDGEFERVGERVERSYPDNGEREVTLRVTDDDGTTATRSVNVTVRNQPPTADFGYQGNPTQGESIRFDGSASADPDGEIRRYEWDFGDGTTETGKTPSHTYDEAGVYTVTLTVTDDDGVSSDPERTSVSVSADSGDDSGDGGGSGGQPSITDGDVTDRSNPGQDRYDVTVEVTDPDGDLDRVEYELRDADTGELLDRETRRVSGSRDRSGARLQSGGGPNKRDRYRIVVTVYDEQGGSDSAETERSGSG